jgi:hypothetical protein
MKIFSDINWKLISLLSLFGIMMGIISVFGLIKNTEWILWIFIGVISASVMARFVKKRHFSHGFYLGMLNVLLATSVQVIFFSEFLSNNSQFAERLESISISMEERLFFLLLAPGVGVLSGLVMGTMTFSAAKFISSVSGQKDNTAG